MVHVIARVEDPYAQHGEDDHPPLAVGLFVEAEILGRVAQNAIVVPRGALRDGNRLLVADAEDRLRYRPAEVLRARHDEVVLRFALEPGDRVVVSSIEAQVEGMPVRPVRDAWQAGSDGRLPAFATGPEAGS